jgi:hypothetical protein
MTYIELLNASANLYDDLSPYIRRTVKSGKIQREKTYVNVSQALYNHIKNNLSIDLVLYDFSNIHLIVVDYLNDGEYQIIENMIKFEQNVNKFFGIN